MAFIIALLAQSCIEPDATAPIIEVLEINPVDGPGLVCGEMENHVVEINSNDTLSGQFRLTDDSDLSQYKLDLHNNFDCHGHAGKVATTDWIVLKNISGFAGILRSWGLTRVDVSHYWLDIGLFPGAIGIPRSYALTDDGNNRDIDLPRQSVKHLKAVLSQEVFLPDHQVLHLHLGFQQNLRQEFSSPDCHSFANLNTANSLAVHLLFQTMSLNGHLHH